MEEPKVIKGWMGWAVVGEGVTVYAKTKAGAKERYRRAELARQSGAAPVPEVVSEDVTGTEI